MEGCNRGFREQSDTPNTRVRRHRIFFAGELKEPTVVLKHGQRLDSESRNETISELGKLALQPRRQSVHMLLHGRESTGRRLNVSQLCKHPRFQHLIPFSRLETPSSEAVLGLDRDGQYSVALAGSDCGLAIKFYGLPSRDQLERRRQQRLPFMSTLLQTVRLNMPRQDGFYHSSPMANTSVQIVASSDWKIGIAIVHHLSSSYYAPVRS